MGVQSGPGRGTGARVGEAGRELLRSAPYGTGMAAVHPQLPRFCAGICLLLALLGCGEGASSPGGAGGAGPRVRNLELAAVGEPRGLVSVKRVAGRFELEAISEGARVLRPREERLVLRRPPEQSELPRLVLPGPFDPSRLDLLVLEGLFPRGGELHVLLVDSEPEPVALDPCPIPPGEELQAVPLQIDSSLRRRLPCEELVVEFRVPGVFELGSLEVLEESPTANHPLPGQEPLPVSIAQEARLAWAVGDGLSAEAVFLVEEGAEELRFHVAAPPRSLPGVLAWRLFEGESLVVEEGVRTSADGWVSVRHPLARHAGKELKLEVEVQSRVAERQALHITPPRVVRRGQDPATVLLITSDTHRGDHVGYLDRGVVLDTPNLDQLAERAVVFEDAWSTTNVTSPSHVTLMTGLHPREHRIVGNAAFMTDAASTLAEAYRGAGWSTAAVVSVQHLGPEGTGLGQGFERMVAPPGPPWPAETAVDRVLGMFADAEGEPLFVWLHLMDAHAPYEPPEPFHERYSDGSRLEELKGQPEALRDALGEYLRGQYRAEVDYVDRQLGRVLDLPRVRDGVLAITADHGEVLEYRGTGFHHMLILPATLHVPLLLDFPGAPSRRVRAPVSNQDVGRTLLDLSGLAGAGFPGRNLLGALEEDHEPPPRFALAAHGKAASVQRGEWFFVLNLRDGNSDRPDSVGAKLGIRACTSELFHLGEDPRCLVDRRSTDPEVARELCALLTAWLRSPAAAPSLSVGSEGRSEVELAALEALGYATGGEEVAEDAPWLPLDCEPCKDL